MKVYDLTATIDENLWYYGTPYVPYETQQLATVKDNGYVANKHILSSHTGTHLECNRHWAEDGESVEKIRPEQAAGKARVLKFDCKEQPYFCIDTEMIREAGGDKLQEGDICILATGWDKRINEENYVWESPFITVEAAEYLMSKKVKMVAIDAPMIGDPRDGMEMVPADLKLPDYTFVEHNVPYVLGIVNAKELPEEVDFIAAPLKLKGADGSPVRALAFDKK